MTEATEAPAEVPVEQTPVPPVENEAKVPGLDLTRTDLISLGVPDGETPSSKDKIPGLELTWEQADFLEINKPAGIAALQKVKQTYTEIGLFFIPGQTQKYVFRGTNRREWTNFVRQMKVNPERQKIEQQGGETQEAIAGQIQTLMQELVFQKFCVLPQLSIDQVRDGLLPGEVSSIYESYMNAIGYTDMPPPAIKI